MSFGRMNTFIDLVKKEVAVDAEGFKSEKEVTGFHHYAIDVAKTYEMEE